MRGATFILVSIVAAAARSGCGGSTPGSPTGGGAGGGGFDAPVEPDAGGDVPARAARTPVDAPAVVSRRWST